MWMISRVGRGQRCLWMESSTAILVVFCLKKKQARCLSLIHISLCIGIETRIYAEGEPALHSLGEARVIPLYYSSTAAPSMLYRPTF